MRIVNIDLSQDMRSPQKIFGGYAGEHKETKLVVTLPSRLLTNDISYYYFDFQTAFNEHITSPNIYKNELVDENKITILLWEQLLPVEGNLSFCVSAIQTQSNGDIVLKGKTSTCCLQILKSPTGNPTAIDVNSTKEDLQQAIDAALQTATDQTYTPTSENAQSGTAVAEAITEAKDYTDTKIGDIDTALDNIIALQNSYIGGNS